MIKTNKKVEYFNIPASFDIETTSTYINSDKVALMYEWTLCVDNLIFIGRRWSEFMTLYNIIVEIFGTHTDRRVIIYVHNLGFEFQFLRQHLEWSNVFSIDVRKPIYGATLQGIEFRCSQILSGYSLAKLGEMLRKYPVQKLVGELDYSKVRHSETPLTDREIEYCINDVLVVRNYIRELMEREGDITKIPLTKTGYVRRYCRDACMYTGKSHKQGGWKYLNHRRLMNILQLEEDEYVQLKRAFQGGFTHASAQYSGRTMYDVASFDFTSSYPAVMVSEQFPMSAATSIEIKSHEEFMHNLKCYCCLFDITFRNLRPKVLYEHPISASRCYNMRGSVEDNGRIVEAAELTTTLTEQDFFIIQQFYDWDEYAIFNFRRYVRGYLPKDFVAAILKLYWDKTTLKDVEGREDEYINSKEMVNSCYGMAVTDICRDLIEYIDGEWTQDKCDIGKELAKYNKSVKRFLFYPWGVWVTAYARKNLFTGIYEFGNDYIYSDTDSVKGLNAARHMDYIEAYNENIIGKLTDALKFHGLDVNLIHPQTIKGKVKTLGVWDFEGVYSRFKTIGAKRYMTEKDGQISITVSGVRKTSAVPYLTSKYGNNVFDAFEDGMYIPPEHTGKLTHTYLDEAWSGDVTDYLGNTMHCSELSGTHLEPADYTMSMSVLYLDYLRGIREYDK